MKGAHLWKRILNEGVMHDAGTFRQSNGADLASMIITSPIIVAPDIEKGGDHLTPPTWRDFASLAIPFPLFWVEWGVVGGDADGQRCGMLTASFPDKQIPGNTCVGSFIIISESGARPFPFGYGVISMTPDGKPAVVDSGFCEMRLSLSDAIKRKNREEDARNHAKAEFSILFSVLMYLGCKNVSLKPHDLEAKQVRRAEKRHGPSNTGYRYHTLVVRPAGARSDSPGQDIGIMPRHVARGHFAEYGPEYGKRLLFGKFAGRFYIPPHVRGNVKNGEVAKDYAIRA